MWSGTPPLPLPWRLGRRTKRVLKMVPTLDLPHHKYPSGLKHSLVIVKATDLHEPVSVIKVVFVYVAPGILALGSQVLASLRHVQTDGRDGVVLHSAEHQQLVDPLSPRGFHGRQLLLVVIRVGLHPDKHPYLFRQPFGL